MGKNRLRGKPGKAAKAGSRQRSTLEDFYPIQAMAPVKGTVVELNRNLPKSIKKRIAPNGLNKPAGNEFSVFVDWSGQNALLSHRVVEKTERSTLQPYSLKENGRIVMRFIDFKGVGVHLAAAERKKHLAPFKKGSSEETWGLAHLPFAKIAFNASKEMQRHGANTEYPIAVIKLHELLDEKGKRISVEQAKRDGLIHTDFEPCVYLRGVTEADRLSTISHRIVKYFDANNDRHGWKSLDDYYQWRSSRAAINLARIHNSGFTHGFISEHNIQVDGGIVDNGGAEAFHPATAVKDLAFLITAINHENNDFESKLKPELAAIAYLNERKKLTLEECIMAYAEFRGMPDVKKAIADHVYGNKELLDKLREEKPPLGYRDIHKEMLTGKPAPRRRFPFSH